LLYTHFSIPNKAFFIFIFFSSHLFFYLFYISLSFKDQFYLFVFVETLYTISKDCPFWIVSVFVLFVVIFFLWFCFACLFVLFFLYNRKVLVLHTLIQTYNRYFYYLLLFEMTSHWFKHLKKMYCIWRHLFTTDSC
jgi:hypothetical protein